MNEKQYLVMVEFTNGEVKEFETNFYRKAFKQYDTWTKHEDLHHVRMIDMFSDKIGDMFGYAKLI
jgi:hypothetical protein